MFNVAMYIGWATPKYFIMDYVSRNSLITLYENVWNNISWFNMFFVIGVVLSTIPAAYIMDRYGRKPALFISALPTIIGSITFALAEELDGPIMLYISQFSIGISNGFIYTVMPMYLAEISSNEIRGSIGVITLVSLKSGIGFVYIISFYVTMNDIGFISIIIQITYILCFLWLPESPYYLLTKNQSEKARKNLIRLRGHTNVQQEFDQMTSLVQYNQKKRITFKEFISPQNQKSLLVILALATIHEFSETLVADTETPSILCFVQLLAVVCGLVFMDIFGRRRIILISMIGSVISNLCLTIYFFAYSVFPYPYPYLFNSLDYQYYLIPVIALVVFNGFTLFGINTMVILGEIFPSHLKGIAAIISVLGGKLCSYTFEKIFEHFFYIDEKIFLVITVLCSLLIPFFWLKLPETNGKSFQVILEELHAKSVNINQNNVA